MSQASTDKVTILWDMVECGVPNGLKVLNVVGKLRNTLISRGHVGPIAISGFCCIEELQKSDREAIAASGISIHEVPPKSSETVREKVILLILLLWALDNPPPSTLCIIGSDRDSSMVTALHAMIFKGYKIVLIHPSSSGMPASLVESAATTLTWEEITQTRVATEQCDDPSKPPASNDTIPPLSLTQGEKKFLIHVLRTLEKDKLPPTREYYSIRISEIAANTDSKNRGVCSMEVVDKGMKTGDLVELEENGELLLLPHGMQQCWTWVDADSLNDPFAPDTWSCFQDFLQNAHSRGHVELSESRYSVACLLKELGAPILKSMAVGQLVQLVQLAVSTKNWLIPADNWMPVKVNIPIISYEENYAPHAPPPSYKFGPQLTTVEATKKLRELKEKNRQSADPVLRNSNTNMEYKLPWMESKPHFSHLQVHRGGVSVLNGERQPWVSYEIDYGVINVDCVPTPGAPHMVNLGRQERPNDYESFGNGIKEAINPSASPMLQEFKAWLSVALWRLTRNGEKGMNLAQVKLHFETDCRKPLDLRVLGSMKMSSLILSLHRIAKLDGVSGPNINVIPANRIIHDLVTTIESRLQQKEEGFDLATLKGAFKEQHGYILEHNVLGFQSLRGLVEKLTEVCRFENGSTKIVAPREKGFS